MRVVGGLLLAVALAGAADLSKVDRKIAKLPKFAAERQFYALLVLGPEAKTKVWFVADGENLHVDRNANGDLTDDGEPVRGTRGGESDYAPTVRSWKLDRLSVPGSYTRIHVSMSLLNPAWRLDPATSNRIRTVTRPEKFIAAVGAIPDVNLSSIGVTIEGGEGRGTDRRQFCRAMFRTSPADAPVFHFDGPLTLGLVESIVPTVLRRGAKPELLVLAAGTPGFSADHAGCFSYLMYDWIFVDARPVIEVEFPAKEPGKYLPPRRIVIDGKC